ncbi:MAG TPA: hypothetical protein VN833_04295 [Candidatus Acidoferrales bacterium]|nr:hypothetical protein [Candidatus Acidoferrales bacterium]
MNIALVSAVSGLLGVLVGTVMPIARERLARSRDARYLAIRIVCILDRYVEDCASTAIDSGEEDAEGVNRARVSAPLPPAYPSDVNWKSIDRSMMYKLLALPASADRAANYVAAVSENVSGPDESEWFEARSHQYSLLGLQAHKLTETLRKEYEIPEIPDRSWDPVSHLRDELKQIEDRQKQRSVAWDEILPTLPTPPTA